MAPRSKNPKPKSDFDENPEWTAETAARAVAIEDMPELAALFPKRGRPKAEVTKEKVSLRLDPDVVEKFRSTGPGWQSAIGDVLKRVQIKRVGVKGKPIRALKRKIKGEFEVTVFGDQPPAQPTARKRA